MKNLKINNKGQSLVEYLIIVAFVAIGSIGVIRLVGDNVKGQFGHIADALAGRPRQSIETVRGASNAETDSRDFTNFMNGAAIRSSEGQNSGSANGL